MVVVPNAVTLATCWLLVRNSYRISEGESTTEYRRRPSPYPITRLLASLRNSREVIEVRVILHFRA
jgi:hypothetical protein